MNNFHGTIFDNHVRVADTTETMASIQRRARRAAKRAAERKLVEKLTDQLVHGQRVVSIVDEVEEAHAANVLRYGLGYAAAVAARRR